MDGTMEPKNYFTKKHITKMMNNKNGLESSPKQGKVEERGD